MGTERVDVPEAPPTRTERDRVIEEIANDPARVGEMASGFGSEDDLKTFTSNIDDDQRAAVVKALVEQLPDKERLEAAQSLVPVGEEAQLAQNVAQDLSPQQKVSTAVEIARTSDDAGKAATVKQIADQLPADQRRALGREVGGVPSAVLKPVWLLVVSGFVLLMLGCAAAVIALIWTDRAPELVIPFVTAAIGVLAGLLVPTPERGGG